MRTLVVGIGALGGIIAARGIAAGMDVSLAVRTEAAARTLCETGLTVSGIGGDIRVQPPAVAPLDAYAHATFDLIVLATKAHAALEVAPTLATRLHPGGTLLPIQNGGVSQLLSDQLGQAVVLGGLSNLAATMVTHGVYRQSNAGHLLMGELAGGESERAAQVARELQRAVGTRVTANMRGSIWSKLLLNCSVTTLGAIAGQTMRDYIRTAEGREVFRRVYGETLAVALASGTEPERMIVDPVPPGWLGLDDWPADDEAWIELVLGTYGDLKASMLQDFERGRRTEIDFINGYAVQVGQQRGLRVPWNAAAANMVHRIEQGETSPGPERLRELLAVGGAV